MTQSRFACFHNNFRTSALGLLALGFRGLGIAVLLLFLPSSSGPRHNVNLASLTAGLAQSLPQASVQAPEFIVRGFELLSRNDPVSAEAAFRKAVDTQPELAAAHRGLGLALWAQGKGPAALRELQVATRLDPSDAEANYELGKLAWTLSAEFGLTQAGAAKGSASDYRSLAIVAMAKALSLRPQSVEIRVSLAELYLEAGRLPDAVGEAEEAVRRASSTPAVHITLGRAYLAGGEENKAESEFKAALGLDPASGEAHLALGQLWLSQKKLSQARDELRRAVAASPNLAAAYAVLAEVLVNVGQPGEVRGLLEKAIALDPRDWHSQYKLARLLMEAGEASRAGQLLEAVTRVRPDFLPAREQTGLALLRRGDLKGALTQAEALLAGSPQSPEGHRLMALALWKQRDFEASLAECAMVLASDPDSAQMLALQALELWQQNQKKEAQRSFAQAAKIEPKVGTAEVFCRLLLCDERDFGPVGEFLRKNHWVVSSAR